MTIDEQRKQLVNEIFALTGDKVDVGDPVVTAALFYAAKLKGAGLDVADEMRAAAKELTGRHQADLSKKAAELAAAAVSQEMKRAKAELLEQGNTLIKKVKAIASPEEAYDPTPEKAYLWGGAGFALGCIVMLLVYLALAPCGDAEHRTISQDAAVGRSLTKALPHLDLQTKAKLLEQIEQHK